MNSKSAPKKKESGSEPAFDLEQQFILRLPPGPATSLRRDIQSGSLSLKDKLSIELHPDIRHGIVRYGSDLYNTKLVDLPCIVETMKTVDRKTFYKTADICQMVVCTNEDEVNPEPEEMESPKKKDSKDKKYQWNHGITAPLKNVRRRRFRKTLKKKVNYMEQPDIEKEVRRLFRMDAEAIDVKWEVIMEDEKPLNDSNSRPPSVIEASGSISQDRHLRRTDTSTTLDMMEQDMILPDLSSSEDEEEKDVNIMDSDEDDTNMTSQDPDTPGQGLGFSDLAPSESQDYMITGDTGTLKAQLGEIQDQLEELREKRQNEEDHMATIDNPDLKERLQSVLDSLIEEESEKEKEYNILMSMLGT